MNSYPVNMYSYFRELAGTDRIEISLPAGSTLGQLLDSLYESQPNLAAMRKSTLVAVNVDYQSRDYQLQPGDEIALFPPVQGG